MTAAPTIPGYEVVRAVGVGGMSRVYLAAGPKGEVALKVLKPEKAARVRSVANFKREADLMASFDHPHVVKGYGYACTSAKPAVHYMALEFMDGETLSAMIKREGKLSDAVALDATLATARAIEYMSEKGLVHRDIKPSNIMTKKSGEIKVLDLGFAIPMGEEAARYEPEGHTSGTSHYMSPEQAQMKTTELDARADIYSLGASLYHMVVGEVPFPGGSGAEVRAKQVSDPLSPERLKNRAIARHIHYFIERMMSKDKKLRYENAAELIQDILDKREGLESLQFDPRKAAPARRPSATERFFRRRP